VTKISNSDHVLVLLRAQLERAKKAGQTLKSQSKAQVNVRQGPVSRVRSMALSDSLSQNEFSRALVSGLLLEHFGEEIVNGAKFQAIVDEIVTQLRESETGSVLLRGAAQELLNDSDKFT
jgi:hypothetical protein